MIKLRISILFIDTPTVIEYIPGYTKNKQLLAPLYNTKQNLRIELASKKKNNNLFEPSITKPSNQAAIPFYRSQFR